MNLFHIEDSWNQHPLISRSIQRETQTKKSTQFVGTFFGLQVDDFLVPGALTPVVPECGILRLNSPENRFSSKNTKPRGCRSLVWEGLITSWGHCWPAVINKGPNNQASTLNSPAGLFHKFDPGLSEFLNQGHRLTWTPTWNESGPGWNVPVSEWSRLYDPVKWFRGSTRGL